MIAVLRAGGEETASVLPTSSLRPSGAASYTQT
jgi:hypothetical protein